MANSGNDFGRDWKILMTDQIPARVQENWFFSGVEFSRMRIRWEDAGKKEDASQCLFRKKCPLMCYLVSSGRGG